LYGEIILGVAFRTVKGDQVDTDLHRNSRRIDDVCADTAASLCDASASAIAGTFASPALKNYYPVKPDMIEIPAKSKLPIVQRINDEVFACLLVIKVNAVFPRR